MPLSITEKWFLDLLEKQVFNTYVEAFPDCSQPLYQWKGKEIERFQEHLAEKVNGRVSEKWFYTHFKSGTKEKLPRVDVLDMLCAYAGYQNWEDFKKKNPAPVSYQQKPLSQERAARNVKKITFIITSLLIALTLLSLWISQMNSKNIYSGCLIDAYRNKAIEPNAVQVLWLRPQESPRTILVDENGCFQISSPDSHISFVVSGSYYLNDTITRLLTEPLIEEQIRLQPDYYAQMIQLFTQSKVEDWEKRRKKLDGMIHNDAKVFQVYDKTTLGIELYNKEEFIDKLTLPLESLKKIEIVDITYQEGKIYTLHFLQKQEVEP